MRLDEVLKELENGSNKGYRRKGWEDCAYAHIIRNPYGDSYPHEVFKVSEGEYGHAAYSPIPVQDIITDDWEEAESIPYTPDELVVVDHLDEIMENISRALYHICEISGLVQDRSDMIELRELLSRIEHSLEDVWERTEDYLGYAKEEDAPDE